MSSGADSTTPSRTAQPRGTRRRRSGLSGWALLAPLIGLFFISLTLRPQLVGIAPLIPQIQDTFGLSHAAAGLIGTIPVICMGIFAFPVAWITRRFGSRNAMIGAVLLIAVSGALRGLAPNLPLLWLTTVGVGIGIAVAGALLPVMVKEHFAHRSGLATGVYATTIQLGTAVSAALAVPIALAVTWRGTMLIFAGAQALFLVLWLVLQRSHERVHHVGGTLAAVPIRSALAWYLTAIFTINAFCFFGLSTWLPAVLVERGWDDVAAGGALGLLNFAGLPVGILVPWLADRTDSHRPMLILAAILVVGGILGVQLDPDLGLLWAFVAGTGLGIIFPTALLLPVGAVDHAADVSAILALMFGVGYTLSASAPALLGWVRDVSGSFGTSLWTMVPIAAALIVLAVTPMPTAEGQSAA
ncbi:MAG TPA: MFS transporter [Candidatus Limnocylindria bacterium]|nr:MFS transporter [Candidatus Limnocylindria bacterium]